MIKVHLPVIKDKKMSHQLGHQQHQLYILSFLLFNSITKSFRFDLFFQDFFFVNDRLHLSKQNFFNPFIDDCFFTQS